MIDLPKPDKRYKVGNIAKDNKGKFRGHPEERRTEDVKDEYKPFPERQDVGQTYKAGKFRKGSKWDSIKREDVKES